ncbi:hypothetical protein [Abyssisolibacter fermentans]|uniref:hypothetical protein n=1 Tax=Abyssisolibacter fermentans TaxID=1766203 RepID=UPI00082CE820|nr:hypothetical protein [Abyssisolibacter fermentans]
MIRIQVNKNKMKEIEKKHWEWFKKTGKQNLENYLYKKIYKDKEEEKEIPQDIYNLLKFLNEQNRIESIVKGNLIVKTDKYNSIDNIIEEIKYEFPFLFESLTKSSISDFLNQIRLQLEKVRNADNIKDKTNISFIKNSIKKFFEAEKEAIKTDYNEILNIIDSIKITGRGIENLSKIENKFKVEINEELKLILNNIFDYNSFVRGDKINFENKLIRWGAYELLNELKITTCPYCNRQYIHTYISEHGKTRADIDHFYPKSKYPFLAVSLYNFIPSCHVCNSSFKGSIDFYKNKCIYPYEEEFGQYAKFETNFYTDKTKETYDINYLLGNSNNFEIKLSIDEDKIKDNLIEKSKKQNKKIDLEKECNDYIQKINNSKETFNLKALYNFHKDYVREIIKKAIIYNDSRIDELYNQYPELFSNREEVLQMVVSNYTCDEDLGKRPLAKLTKDICEELGLKY